MLASRNATSSGNPRVQRGKSGWRFARVHHTAAAMTRKASRDSPFTSLIWAAESGQLPPPCSRSHTMNHRLSQSAVRVELNRKKVDHAFGANIAKGTFTAYTVTADEAGFHSCRKLEFVDGKLVTDTIVPFPKGPK